VNNKKEGAFMTVHYTPGQLRNVACIPPETYRHWKKALSPLRRDRSHSPCFAPGDLVAVAVVRTLSIDLGMRVSALSAIAEALFDLCNSAPWPTLERGRLILDLPQQKVEFRSELSERPLDGLAVVVPLWPIVTQLRDQLLTANEPSDQQTLQFPLTALSPPPASTVRGRS
jgi:hypothetical protein